MFKKILVANRGEIAVRIIRACHEMGIAAVAVYSDVDRAALHVRMADEACHIGASAAPESYLNIEKILAAAKKSGAEAVHPGYGFLSENADFAEACTDAGLKFIGPSASSMRLMGSKISARRQAQQSKIACVPGTLQPVKSLDEAMSISSEIGFPVMLKAAAGGGGKGMRLVQEREQLKSALEVSQSEAQRAFGDSEVYIEKAIVNPRHIEIQILADEHGGTIHLGERECSIQRRHQKVLEESPSTAVDSGLRGRMGEAAVRIARDAGYTNAGTIEFLVDQDRNFYFLEMNTRLQVEHPVTEIVTGLDLVALQIKIAANERVLPAQKDVQFRGHAIECRIYAEDPANNYFPSPGMITLLNEPSGHGVRLDSGVYEGWTVPNDYDPLLAKLTAYGENREQAAARLRRAVDETFIGGIQTNLQLFRQILRDPDFLAGEIDTGYLQRLKFHSLPGTDDREIAAIAAGIFATLDQNSAGAKNREARDACAVDGPSKWKHTARVEALE